MRIGGIIAEYDPFHNGHKKHIDNVRNSGVTHIVAVISGSFTQRGEPAALTKFDRAHMALAGGGDLVLENPLPFAMASAERFAEGGVGILQALGCVDTLSFGSECGDIAALGRLATLTKTDAYQSALRTALGDGIPYAAAGEKAALLCGEDRLAALLSSPNNTLGLEYIRATERLGADFTLHTLKRVGASHNAAQPTDNTASASYLRTRLQDGDATAAYIPSNVQTVLQKALDSGYAPANGSKLHGALLARLRSMTLDEFTALPYISEGLDNRLYRAARAARTYDELLSLLATRRYPLARLRRILWAALLGMPHESAMPKPLYIRVLAMNQRGREILTAAKPTLPVITRAAQIPTLSADAQAMLSLEERATDLHTLALPNPLPCGTDWTIKL